MARGFTLVPGAFADMKVRGQAALIHAEMSETEPRTSAQVAAAIKEKLETRQDPERVVSFYMTTWKKKGLVAVHDVDAPAAQAASEPAADGEQVGAAIDPVDAESTGATTEERIEAATEADVEAAHAEVKEGMKVSEAVLAVLHSSGEADVNTIVDKLSGFNYTARPEQVRGALSNLLRRRVVSEAEGRYQAVGR